LCRLIGLAPGTMVVEPGSRSGGEVVSILVTGGSGERHVVRGASPNQPGVSYGPDRPIYLSE
jgi:hypothetical protein